MRSKKVRIGLLIVLSLVLILMYFAPGIARNYLVKNSPELIGRQIALGDIKYNYFTSTAKAYDFKLFEANGSDVFVSFDTLLINLEPLKYLAGKIEIEQFYLIGLTTTVVMQDSSFNFDDMIAFYSGNDTLNIEEDSAAEALKYAVSDIVIKNSDLYFDHRNVNKLTKLEDINLKVPFIGWDQQGKSTADVRFNLSNGGYVETILNLNPNDGGFDAGLDIDKLDLSAFYEYAAQSLNVNSMNGTLNARLQLDGNVEDITRAILTGNVEVTDFVMTDLADKKILGAKNISCDLSRIDYANDDYQIGKLELTDPYTFFELDSTTNNLDRLMKDKNATAAQNEAKANMSSTDNLKYSIDRLIIKNGVLDYTDNLTGQPFDYHLNEIKINTQDIRNNVELVTLYSTMVLNNRGNLVAKLGFNPNDFTKNFDLDIVIEKFLLSDINIYTDYYMGHSVMQGDMYYYSKSKVTDGIINSENRLLVKNAKLETTGGGLNKIPLKFAFFLLTDKNGDVNMEIPVKGDLNHPSVKVSTIVWYAFKNLIGKTVAAPVNFLVGLVGGDPKELEEMTFAYTDTIPSQRQYRQLNKLIDLERQKEQLAIKMTYYVDRDLQKEALAKEWVGQGFNKEGNNYLKDEDRFREYVFSKVQTDTLSFNAAVMKLASSVNLDSLSLSRTDVLVDHIRNYLKRQHLDTNIKVEKGDSNAPENVGAYPTFKFTYGLLEENDQTVN